MANIPMTVIGEKALREELKRLKKIERPAVIEAIAEARAHGDLKENAEYHAAREKQGLMEARIADIENKLAHAQVIDVTQLSKNGKVVFGVTAELLNIDNDETMTYKIVGEDEANVNNGTISITSPIARALIGKEEGDIADVMTPRGQVSYEIVAVKYV